MKALPAKHIRALVLAAAALVSSHAWALDLSENPERSVLFGFRLGAALDLDDDARFATDRTGSHAERYAVDGFLFGLYAGFRFNEIVGVEGGWHQSRHDGQEEWGDVAGYSLWHLAVRLAVPTPSRQTVVFDLGPSIGVFSYGSVSGIDDNQTLAVGGRGGVVLEHEFGLSMVGTLGVHYSAMFRRGAWYSLEAVSTDEDGTSSVTVEDSLDFSEDRLVHLLWIAVGIQFEWSLR